MGDFKWLNGYNSKLTCQEAVSRYQEYLLILYVYRIYKRNQVKRKATTKFQFERYLILHLQVFRVNMKFTSKPKEGPPPLFVGSFVILSVLLHITMPELSRVTLLIYERRRVYIVVTSVRKYVYT